MFGLFINVADNENGYTIIKHKLVFHLFVGYKIVEMQLFYFHASMQQ